MPGKKKSVNMMRGGGMTKMRGGGMTPGTGTQYTGSAVTKKRKTKK